MINPAKNSTADMCNLLLRGVGDSVKVKTFIFVLVVEIVFEVRMFQKSNIFNSDELIQ